MTLTAFRIAGSCLPILDGVEGEKAAFRIAGSCLLFGDLVMKDKSKFSDYLTGMKLSIPVFVGYFSVSFGFGALAVTKGLTALQSVLISITTLAGAGQFAGLAVISAGAPLIDMVITQLVINSRYSLMSLALSQKMGDRIGFFPRLFIAFHNTDEIFALAME